MGFKQRQLADRLGVNEQTVANYEKNKPIPASSENLMRLEFLLWIMPEDEYAEVAKRVAEIIKARRRNPKSVATASVPPADIQLSIAKLWQVEVGKELIGVDRSLATLDVKSERAT